MKTQLVSVVEDDRFFRDSMGRLMRSLGYTVEAFPSAADFLASPRLAETACPWPPSGGPGSYRRIASKHAVIKNVGRASLVCAACAAADSGGQSNCDRKLVTRAQFEPRNGGGSYEISSQTIPSTQPDGTKQVSDPITYRRIIVDG